MSTGVDISTKLAMVAGTIATPGIRDFTIEMMKAAPPSFRTARASKVHHPPDEREAGGNALHTLRVVKLVKLMADACDFDRITTDISISAAIIHDLCRYGLNDEDEDTSKEHPLVPRRLAEKHSITCDHADAIFEVAEHHMGKWGPRPYVPRVTPDSVLHFADAISAHANEVWEPLGESNASWVGGVPFSDKGMTQDLVTLMEELAEGDGYWKTALSFIRSSSSRKWGTLSVKQQDWAINIIASLEAELNRRTAEEVFKDEL